MNKTKRKVVLRQIREWASLLPEETYLAYPKYYEPQLEKDESGKEVLRFGWLQTCKVNHARRMKKMFDLYSYTGIDGYLRLYNFKLSNQQNQ